MRQTPFTPYLPLPRTVDGTPRAPVPRLDVVSGGFTFERLRGGISTPPPSTTTTATTVHVKRRTLGSSTAFSAAAFTVAFVVYLVTGFLAISVSDGYPSRGDLELLEGSKCITAYRNAHHTEVRLFVGTPSRSVRLLVRTDRSKACHPCGAAYPSNATVHQASIVILKADILYSTSLVCDAGTTECTDVAIVSRWRNSRPHNELRPLHFLYGAHHLAGLEAPRLGLDGEITLCHGVRYVLTSRQMCAAPASVLVSSSTPASCPELHVTTSSRTTIGGRAGLAAFVTTACDLRLAKGLWSHIPAAHTRCASCDTVVEVFTAAASDLSRWWTFASSHMFDTTGEDSVGAMHAAVEAGPSCVVHPDPAIASARAKFDLSCNTAIATGATEGTACGRGPTVAPMRGSGHRLAISVDPDGTGACFVATPDPSLHANAGAGRYLQPAGALTSGEAWVRLLLMVFAAAIVWVRRDDTMENADRLFVRCVEIAVHGASHTIVDVDAQTRALGLGAALARLVLAITHASEMISDGQTRVIVSESVAATLSIVHWCVLYGGKWVPSIRSLRDSGLRPALGGSSAIVDVTCATMMAFATTPVRGDVETFDVIARLLTTVLIGVACISRCLLSAACSGVLTQSRFNSGAVCSPNGLALSIALFWWLQTASIAIVVVDLFASPVSIDWTRESMGSSQMTATLLFVVATLITAPRLTANAVAITMGVEEGEEREKKI